MFRRPSGLSDIVDLHGGDGVVASSSVAVGCGPADDGADNIAAFDRDLVPDELSELRSIIRGALWLSNSSCAIQAEEDVTDLVDFAVDLIGDGLAIPALLGELEFLSWMVSARPSF